MAAGGHGGWRGPGVTPVGSPDRQLGSYEERPGPETDREAMSSGEMQAGQSEWSDGEAGVGQRSGAQTQGVLGNVRPPATPTQTPDMTVSLPHFWGVHIVTLLHNVTKYKLFCSLKVESYPQKRMRQGEPRRPRGPDHIFQHGKTPVPLQSVRQGAMGNHRERQP